jgi:hypothetical protein
MRTMRLMDAVIQLLLALTIGAIGSVVLAASEIRQRGGAPVPRVELTAHPLRRPATPDTSRDSGDVETSRFGIG